MSTISRAWPAPAILGVLILLVVRTPEGGRMPGLSIDDIAAIESAVGGTVPPALRAYLLDPPPDAARLCDQEWFCAPMVESVVGATEALFESGRVFEIAIPRGSIGLATDGLANMWFLHPDHGDDVWIALHESSSIEDDGRTVGEHLRFARSVFARVDLRSEIECASPPTLVAGLGYEPRPELGSWTFYTPYPADTEPLAVEFSSDEVEAMERFMGHATSPAAHDRSLGLDGEPVDFAEFSEQWFSAQGPGETPEEARAREHREVILRAAGRVLERTLTFDDRHFPTNLPAARTRALQYIRSRLDPDFVVEPPFEPTEIADLP